MKKTSIAVFLGIVFCCVLPGIVGTLMNGPRQRGGQVAVPDAPAPKFEHILRKQASHLLWIDHEHASDLDVYRQAIAGLYERNGFVEAHFWTDRAMIPEHVPSLQRLMTQEQADAMVAQYYRNDNTGLRRFRLRDANGDMQEVPDFHSP